MAEPSWQETITAVAAVGTLVGTSVLAGVAWFQINASKRSAREIFARQSRQHYFDIALQHPNLAAKQANLKNSVEREEYFSFLSLLFSTVDDALSHLPSDTNFALKAMAEDITGHMLYLAVNQVEDWRFHFSLRSLDIVQQTLEQSAKNRKRDSDELDEQLRPVVASAHSFGLGAWVARVEEIVAPLEPELAQALCRWEFSTPELEELDERPWAALRNSDGFADLPEGSAELVRQIMSLTKQKQLSDVAVNLFVTAEGLARKNLVSGEGNA